MAIIGLIAFLAATSQALQRVSPKNQEMTPGKVFLCFIPYFSMYWVFVVVHRVGESLKRELRDEGRRDVGDAGTSVGFAFAGLAVLSNVIGFFTRTASDSPSYWYLSAATAALMGISGIVYARQLKKAYSPLELGASAPSGPVGPLLQFALTLFISAFILFLVQPIIGKLILPKLGGTPQVWNTCMVFFQGMLLLGYFYTHFVTTRLRPRMQLILHCVLLAAPLLILTPGFLNISAPFDYIRGSWTPPLGSNPIWPTLTLLLMVVGLPFLVVSTTAPLLQKWFALTDHPASKDPYFLYGASNLGSMLSLIAYPFLIEPNLPLAGQGWLYFAGYIVLGLLVLVCVFMVFPKASTYNFAGAADPGSDAPRSTAKIPAETAIQRTDVKQGMQAGPAPARGTAAPAAAAPNIRMDDKVDGFRRLRWILLAAVPSSLMLAVTSHITTDLSPIPLFWLIPLAIYLATFIFVFARWPIDWVETVHPAVVYIQPVAIALMVFALTGHTDWRVAAFIHTLGFTVTTFLCHGELAKDRPSPRYLTEFYLMMSVGGVLGGILNGIIAPLIPYAFEFYLAIIVACLVRPSMSFGGWLEDLFAGSAPRPAARVGETAPEAESTPMSYAIDAVVGIVAGIIAIGLGTLLISQPYHAGQRASPSAFGWSYALPTFLLLAFMGRPFRFGLGITGVLLASVAVSSSTDPSIFQDRSYFGILKVKQGQADGFAYTQLVHGHILHGQNFKLRKPEDRGNPKTDWTRFATTYYHEHGPIGRMMAKYNWFNDNFENNTYHSDSRVVAAILGHMGGGGLQGLPLTAMFEPWTEPPCATIGLGTGTMAHYGRPFQHVHFYEIDNHVRKLSFPSKNLNYFVRNEVNDKGVKFPIDGERDKAYFSYLIDALDRGCAVQLFMGDARLRMALPYENYYEHPKTAGGPENFYKMMVVDAFSSDAIPAHLITKQAIEMYMDHLSEDGVLCLHTSNRYVRLPKVIVDVASDLDLVWNVGHDAPIEAVETKLQSKGHSTSEWVMVARKKLQENGKRSGRDYLAHLRPPPGYRSRGGPYWSVPSPSGNNKYLWTDDYYSLWNIMGGRDDD